MSFLERRRFLWILFLIGAGLVGAAAAMGTTLAAMPFEELAGRATAVARLRCLSARSFLEGGEIWTETQFETIDVQKGSLSGLVTVRLLGGRTNGLHARVDGVPEFAAGEEVYLFLWKGEEGDERVLEQKASGFRILGWTQGTFPVRRNEKTGRETVTQDSTGAAVFDARTRAFRRNGIREMAVGEFRPKLRAVLES